MNMTLFNLAVILMSGIILYDFLKKKYDFSFDKINFSQIFSGLIVDKKPHLSKSNIKTINKTSALINKKTGEKSLTLLDAGLNKTTVLATLRQITGIDYSSAKHIINTIPSTFMVNISEKEANLTKQALEFVGAKVEIK